MARYRRSYRPRRRSANYTWQAEWNNTRISLEGAADAVISGVHFHTQPGLGPGGAAQVPEPFTDSHVLERIRGAMTHNADTSLSPSGNAWFPFTVAAVKVPKGMSATAIDLFNNADGEDFLYCHNVVCRADYADSTPNWHEVDSKAKRVFEVGDQIAWIYSAIKPVSGTVNIDFCVNLRLLWKLKI